MRLTKVLFDYFILSLSIRRFEHSVFFSLIGEMAQWKETSQPSTVKTGTKTLRGRAAHRERRQQMADSVYKVIELVGSSPSSWEEAAKNAVEKAGQTLRDLRVAEVSKLDMKVEDGKVAAYRARVNLSFKYGGGE